MNPSTSIKRSGAGIKQQASVDLLVSYGLAILMIAISLYVIVNLGVVNARVVPEQCSAAPSFFCGTFTLNSTGVLAMQLGQSTGGTLKITGVACSSSQNSISDRPLYGNIFVTNSLSYYPSAGSAITSGITLYSDNVTNYMYFYCYTARGAAALSTGVAFSGFVWLNYTTTNLPGYTVRQIASVTVKSS